MDLAIIKPRWTVKHDFRVELPRNSKLDELAEEIDDQLDEPSSSRMRGSD